MTVTKAQQAALDYQGHIISLDDHTTPEVHKLDDGRSVVLFAMCACPEIQWNVHGEALICLKCREAGRTHERFSKPGIFPIQEFAWRST